MTLTVILILSAVVAGLDQLFKYLVVQNLAPDGHVTVIDHLLSLVYVENRGVAFGMFQNHIWVFALVTFLFIGVFVYLIVSKRFHGKLFYLATLYASVRVEKLIRGMKVKGVKPKGGNIDRPCTTGLSMSISGRTRMMVNYA